ncbi:MAG: recombination protein RecR [Salibacteraceae bacterium]|jgi:recombination protein RecR
MSSSSKLLDQGVEAFASLPGIGRKTALRLALHMLRQPLDEVHHFSESIKRMRTETRFCNRCHNISETALCDICTNNKRSDSSTICVVEDMRDIIAIENTQQYFGTYHVLGGHISPIDGIGPTDLNIESLIKRVDFENIEEVIFALNSTMEGDTTSFYIYRRLIDFNIKTSVIARGIAVGDELEYADEITLGRSLLHRTPFDSSL